MSRMPRHDRFHLCAAIGVALILGACTPASAPPGQGAPESPAPSAPKTLVLTQAREIDGIARTGRTSPEVSHSVTAGLSRKNPETLEVEAGAAEALPALSNGSWVVDPDGTMVTTWKLRPNVFWHDGTPFSSRDLTFGWEVNADPQIPANNRRPGDLMSTIETPDDRTLIIHWKTSYQQANAILGSEMFPMPRHILEALYRSGDYNAFINGPYWSSEMVHIGPYKVARFELGSHVELVANDLYYLGRPKVDRVIFRVISDPNTSLANILAGEVDVGLDNALTIEGGLTADREWASKGEGVVKFTPLNWTWVNPSLTNPIFGWQAPSQNKVRQAMLHAINRQELVDTIFAGKEQVVHFPMSPGRRQYAAADAVATKYPFDPQRAEQLFGEAGWRRGADGVLANDRGERFSVEFRTSGDEELHAAIANQLKAAGVETNALRLSDTQDKSVDYRNRWPGLYLGRFNVVVESWFDRFHSSRTPSEADQWRGFGVTGWPNAAKDRILENINSSLNTAEIDGLMVEFARQFTTDLPHLPIKYNAEVTAYRSNVRGVPVRYESGGNTVRTWNIHEWDKV